MIDDSKIAREKVKSALEKDYHVVEAINGNDGFAKAQVKKDLSLIISDFNMPGELNGLEMIEKIRGIEQHKNTPIFMLTSETSEDLRKRGKLLGITGWIVKPCNEEIIKEVIRKYLDQYTSSSVYKL